MYIEGGGEEERRRRGGGILTHGGEGRGREGEGGEGERKGGEGEGGTFRTPTLQIIQTQGMQIYSPALQQLRYLKMK